MTTFVTPDVGKVWVPDAEAYTVGPAFSGHVRRHIGIVSYTHRSGLTGKTEAREWSHAIPQIDGLMSKWREHDWLRERFRRPEDFVRAVRFGVYTGRYPMGMVNLHNARIQNGGKMVAKSFWGATSSPTVSTVNAPTYIALNNNSAFTAANFTYAHDGTDQSLGNGATNVGANVTTNEWTNHGLARANGTLSGYTDATALDGTFSLTNAFTFTDTSGSDSVYGTGLVDASSTTSFNLYAEAAFTSATLQNNDTLAVTWTVSD